MSTVSKIKDLMQERIVGPIKSQCPEHVPMKAYLELIFSTNSRTVARYYSPSGPLEIPGIYCVNGCIPIKGIGDEWRKMRSKRGILVRHDETVPNVYHVDNVGHVFMLTKQEWRLFKRQLRVSIWSEEV